MKRSEEITRQYFAFLEKHIQDVIAGTVPEFMEVNEIAGNLPFPINTLQIPSKKKPVSIPVIFMTKKLLRKPKKC
jgi:hypothetical protein